MGAAKATTNHETIRLWVEDRGGCPAAVKGTGEGAEPGILRVDFPGFGGKQTLEPIEWDAFFEAFDDNDLAFLYQADRNSRFCKLVSRDSVDLDDDEEEARAPKSNGKHRSVHAIQLLERQHREVEGLFERFFQADTNDAKERLFARLADHLAAHSMIEETIFYPEVLDGETEEILQNAVNEHREIKRILAELLDQEIDVDFDAQMGDLQSEVEHHIEEEETQLFEMLGHVPRESFMEMGERLKERFDALFRAEPRYDVPSEIRGPARA